MDTVSNSRIKEKVKDYVEKLSSHIEVEETILFGSRARGTGDKNSDIDLIIISPDFKDMHFMKRLTWLSKMRGEEFMSPGMDIFGYTREEFKRAARESTVLEEARKKGVAIK